MPKFSVIVPIYNVESYLRRCIDSILAQDFKDFELILVDDGSPDNCPSICDEYAKKDERIRVVHKKNGGPADSRNAGLEIANGEYIMFIDSDDYVEPKLLSTCLEKLNEGFEMVSFAFYGEAEDKQEIYYGKEYKFEKMNAQDLVLNYLLSGKIGWAVWSKVFDRKILNQHSLSFEKNQFYAEDMYFCLTYCPFITSANHIKDPLYHYEIRENSIMTTSGTKVNANRLNELSKALFMQYKKDESYKELLSIFPCIHAYIAFNEIEKLLQTYEFDLARKLFLEDLQDKEYFFKECKEFVKMKKEYFKLSSMAENKKKLFVALFEYMLDGNFLSFRIKKKLLNSPRLTLFD